MRKVGLWNFHQMEGMVGDGEVSPKTVAPSAQAAGPATPTMHDGHGDLPASASSTPATPCRMKLRSQDSTRSDQASFKQIKIGQLNKQGFYVYAHFKQNDFAPCLSTANEIYDV